MKSLLSRFKEEYLIQLGRIVVNMNQLEFHTSSSIFLLTSTHHTASQEYFTLMSVIGNVRFARLIDVLDRVFRAKVTKPRLLKRFDSIKTKAISLYDKRNTYIHSMWLFAKDDSFVSRMKNLKFPRVERDFHPTVQELSALADELDACGWELLSFVSKATEALGKDKLA